MGKRVAVIGARPSGLAQLWAFQLARTGGAEIPETVCNEKQADCGGLWNHTWRTRPNEYGAIRYQGDCVRELIAEIDYPGFDVDSANAAFFQWKKHEKQNIMTFRENRYRSVVTGTMAPIHHYPRVNAMDDSMDSYLQND